MPEGGRERSSPQPVPRSARRAPTVRDRGRRAADPCGITSVRGLRGQFFCPERRRRKEEEEDEDEESPERRRRRHGGRP